MPPSRSRLRSRFAVPTLAAALAAGFLGSAEASHRIYVTNELSGDLSVIDGDTHTVVATAPLGKRPRGIQASSDGSHLYIALSGSPLAPPGVDESTLPPADKSADGIGVFSVKAQRVENVVTGVSDPEQLAVGLDGRHLFIASEDTGTAVVANADGSGIAATLSVGGEPEGVAIAPDGRYVYVSSEAEHRVAIIDTQTLRVVGQIDVGKRPRAIAFSPDGERAYVTGEIDGTLTVLDTAARSTIATVRLPDDARPMGIAVSRDGARVYVATGRGRNLLAIDGATLAVQASVEVGERPWGVALSPDGRYAYTANGPSNDVTVVDTARMEVVEKIPVGERPWGIVVVE